MNYYKNWGWRVRPPRKRSAGRTELAQVLHPIQHRDEALRSVCSGSGRPNVCGDSRRPRTPPGITLSLQEARERREELGPGRLELVREFVSSLSLATGCGRLRRCSESH